MGPSITLAIMSGGEMRASAPAPRPELGVGGAEECGTGSNGEADLAALGPPAESRRPAPLAPDPGDEVAERRRLVTPPRDAPVARARGRGFGSAFAVPKAGEWMNKDAAPSVLVPHEDPSAEVASSAPAGERKRQRGAGVWSDEEEDETK